MKGKQTRLIGFCQVMVLIAALTLVIAACSSTSTTSTSTPTTLTLYSIAINPEAPANLTVGSTETFTAIGTYSDGSTTNITSQVIWSTSDPTVATISSAVVTGIAPGTCDISANMPGVTSPPAILTVVVPTSATTTP